MLVAIPALVIAPFVVVSLVRLISEDLDDPRARGESTSVVADPCHHRNRTPMTRFTPKVLSDFLRKGELQ